MKTSGITEIRNEMIDSPLVRIDALDENYCSGIREFFALNGCKVFTNTAPSNFVTYHLIIGDLEFVKSILEKPDIHAQKTVSIIWSVAVDDIANLKTKDTKFALIDPKPISDQLLGDLCTFFFTSSQRVKDFQKNPPERIPHVNQITHTEKIPNQREGRTSAPINVKEDKQRVEHTIEQIFSIPKPPEKQTYKQPRKSFLWLKISTLFLCISVLPILVYYLSVTSMTFIVYQEMKCLTRTKVSCIDQSKSFTTWSANAWRVLPYTKTLTSIVEKNSLANETVLTILEKLSSTAKASKELEDVALQFANSFLTTDLSKDDTSTTVVQIDKMKTQLFSLHANLDISYELIEKMIENPPFPLNIPSIQMKMEEGMATFRLVRTKLQTAERLLLLYPYIAGYKKPLEFLFLFQNNTELRPTGGFIGSIMDATIEDGAITTMEVQDVYAIDGQLRGHVDPPTPIKDVLNQEHWYLRDSNWDPDFEETAKRALWFYEKETGKTVQGVVAVNSSLMVQLLKQIGPIQLPDTKDTITADNFYEKSIAYTQTDFFPGSTQKKDFLGNLTKAAIDTVVGGKSLSGLQVFGILDAALRSKTIQFYFADPEAEQLTRQFNWAGKMPSKLYCQDTSNEPCIFDATGIIEANLGVNKANFFIKRTDTNDLVFQNDGKIMETQTRTLTNTASGQTGSGVYKAYLRWYVPSVAHIINFTIDNTAVPAKIMTKNAQVTYPYGELDTNTPDFTVLGLALVLNPGQSTTITVNYEYPASIAAAGKTLDFHLFRQKQSGIEETPTITRLHYQAPWILEKSDLAPAATLAKEGYLEYNSTMSEDADIQIHFAKE